MKKFWLIFLLPLIVISCPKDEIVPEDNGPVLAETKIGPDGGMLEAEGISITVPPGTFPSTYTIQITDEEVYTDEFGENAVTPVYRITGIPSVTTGTITIRIEYEGILGEESHLAAGDVDEMLEPEKEVTTYALYPATDSSGYLVASIPPLNGEEEAEGELKSALFYPALIRVMYGISYMKAQKGTYFNYSYPSNLDQQKILQLDQYMEEAMRAYFELGLVEQKGLEAAVTLFGKPTVVVTDKNETGEGAYGIKMPRMGPVAKDEGGMAALARYPMYMGIKVNTSKSALEQVTYEELRASAYIWVYRMLYYLYCGDSMDWYAYASALYMKEKFTGNSFYKTEAFPIVGISPFIGMEAGSGKYIQGSRIYSNFGGAITPQEKMHAVGMYPFIKYLDQRYPGDNALWMNIIMEILNSESHTAMEGIINTLDEPEYQWWPGFFEKYMTRQLVDVPAGEFLKLFPGVDYQVDFFYEKDTSRFNEAEYADLSARLFNVSFLFPSFEKEATLNLKATPSSQNWDYVTAMAFGLKDKQLEYFDQAADLTIANLKTLTDNSYSSIPVAVVNSSNGPSDETIDIELESTLKTTPAAPANFFQVEVEVTARVNYTDNTGSTSEDDYTYASTVHEGDVIDHTFTASWSDPGEYYISSGTIEIEFDPDRYPKYITRYSFTETHDYYNTSYSYTYTVTGENLDFEGYKTDLFDAPLYYFYAYDENACNYITTLDYESQDSDGEITLSTDGTPICDDHTFFWIKLYYEVD